jgi:hypothetical protein
VLSVPTSVQGGEDAVSEIDNDTGPHVIAQSGPVQHVLATVEGHATCSCGRTYIGASEAQAIALLEGHIESVER